MQNANNIPAGIPAQLTTEAPWWWKMCGLVLIAAGGALLFVPRLIGASELWVRLLFIAGAALMAGIGVAFLKSKPASTMIGCPRCFCQTKRSRLTYYCPQCGQALYPDEDELKPSEINCPFCEEAIAKGVTQCPHCAKALPQFGTSEVNGRMRCLWCKSEVAPGQKFCKSCSAPLESGASGFAARV